METITKDVLIIGGGAAGMNAALNLDSSKKVALVEMPGANSLFAPWNLMLKDKDDQKKEMLEVGNHMNDTVLVETFLSNIEDALNDLKKLGISLRESNIGIVPAYRMPGKSVRDIFMKKIEEMGVEVLKGKVKGFSVNNQGYIGGITTVILDKKEVNIFFKHLIIASGGLSGMFEYYTGSPHTDGSILSLCYEAGFQMRDLEFMMFHPFLITDKRFSRFLISGDILTKMVYKNEKGEKFLSGEISNALMENQYHSVFPQMVREFYKESLRGKIFGELICDKNWFESFKEKNEFGYIFEKFSKEDIGSLELHPAFHSSIGGLVIDENAKTSQPNVYAAGEVTGGLHGSNRIGGLAILEALVFGKIAAQSVNSSESNQENFNNLKDINFSKDSGELKQLVWQNLGPVKNKENLNKFKKLLENKKNLSSNEKLVKKIIEISLMRKESIGSFYREDLPKKDFAKSSFLKEEEIMFR